MASSPSGRRTSSRAEHPGEGEPAEVCKGGGKDDGPERGALPERRPTDAVNGFRQGDAGERQTAEEDAFADLPEPGGEGDLPEPGAVGKGIVVDGRQLSAQRHVSEPATAAEGAGGDDGDLIGHRDVRGVTPIADQLTAADLAVPFKFFLCRISHVTPFAQGAPREWSFNLYYTTFLPICRGGRANFCVN